MALPCVPEFLEIGGVVCLATSLTILAVFAPWSLAVAYTRCRLKALSQSFVMIYT